MEAQFSNRRQGGKKQAQHSPQYQPAADPVPMPSVQEPSPAAIAALLQEANKVHAPQPMQVLPSAPEPVPAPAPVVHAVEKAEPAPEVPVPAPVDVAAVTTGKKKGLMDRLRATGAVVLEKAKGRVAEARALAQQGVEKANVRLTEARALARSGVERLAKAAAPVTSRIDASIKAAQQAKEAALLYCDAGMVAAAASYEQIRRNGMMPFVASAAKGAKGAASEAIQASRSRAVHFQRSMVASATDAVKGSREVAAQATGRAGEISAIARTKAVEVATDPKFQATAAGVVGGATALGASGGAAGLMAGSTVGALVGLVPAVFTLGLSIPIGAAIGGGAGLVVGTTVGSTAGALTGGAAGYGAYSKRGDIREGAQQTFAKVGCCAEYVKGRAYASADYMKEKASVVRTRLVGSGTGGTDTSD